MESVKQAKSELLKITSVQEWLASKGYDYEDQKVLRDDNIFNQLLDTDPRLETYFNLLNFKSWKIYDDKHDKKTLSFWLKTSDSFNSLFAFAKEHLFDCVETGWDCGEYHLLREDINTGHKYSLSIIITEDLNIILIAITTTTRFEIYTTKKENKIIYKNE